MYVNMGDWKYTVSYVNFGAFQISSVVKWDLLRMQALKLQLCSFGGKSSRLYVYIIDLLLFAICLICVFNKMKNVTSFHEHCHFCRNFSIGIASDIFLITESTEWKDLNLKKKFKHTLANSSIVNIYECVMKSM